MKANGQPSKREIELTLARVAGYHNDTARYARILCERRLTTYDAIKQAYITGMKQRESGMLCSCCS